MRNERSFNLSGVCINKWVLELLSVCDSSGIHWVGARQFHAIHLAQHACHQYRISRVVCQFGASRSWVWNWVINCTGGTETSPLTSRRAPIDRTKCDWFQRFGNEYDDIFWLGGLIIGSISLHLGFDGVFGLIMPLKWLALELPCNIVLAFSGACSYALCAIHDSVPLILDTCVFDDFCFVSFHDRPISLHMRTFSQRLKKLIHRCEPIHVWLVHRSPKTTWMKRKQATNEIIAKKTNGTHIGNRNGILWHAAKIRAKTCESESYIINGNFLEILINRWIIEVQKTRFIDLIWAPVCFNRSKNTFS